MSTTDVALWRQRFVRFALGGSAPLIGGVLSVLRNKWLATHLEASGLGVLAQVIAGQNWLGTMTGLGLNLPVARAVAAATAAGDLAAVRRITWTALTLVGGCALVVVGFGTLAAPAISGVLIGSEGHAGLVRISMAGVAGLAVYTIVQGLFAGRSDVRGPLALAVAGGLASLAVTIALVPRLGLAGGTIGATVAFPAAAIGALALHRKGYASAFVPVSRPLFDRSVARGLIGVGAASLFLALLDQGAMLGLRAHYLRAHGVAANGLLQAALGLSQQLGGLFYAYLASYAFGKISGEVGVHAVAGYTRRQWNPLMALAALAMAAAMLASRPLLHLFYSRPFEEAQPMLAWCLFGEYVRIGVQVLGLGALPLGGVALWVPIGAVSVGSFVAAYAVLQLAGVGALSLPLAYSIGNLATLVFVGVWMSRRGVRLGPPQALATLLALTGLAAIALLVAR